SGLPLVPKERLDPRVTSTYGLGQLLEAARARGVRKIIAGIGGSATNDGGAGMAQALGYRLLEAGGQDLPRGGAALARLDRGAAGGAGAGFVAFLNARLVRGAPLVVEAAGLDLALQGATVVMSGEGRVDGQTAYGKGPAEVAARSARAGVPVVLLAGALGEGW